MPDYSVRWNAEDCEMEVLCGGASSVVIPFPLDDRRANILRELATDNPSLFRIGRFPKGMCNCPRLCPCKTGKPLRLIPMPLTCALHGCSWCARSDADESALGLFVDPVKVNAQLFSEDKLETYDWPTMRKLILDQLRDAALFVRTMLKGDIYLDLPNQENIDGMTIKNVGFWPHISDSSSFLATDVPSPCARFEMTSDLLSVVADWISFVLDEYSFVHGGGDHGLVVAYTWRDGAPADFHTAARYAMDMDFKSVQLQKFYKLFESHDSLQYLADDDDEDYLVVLDGIAAHLRLVLGRFHRVDILDESDAGRANVGAGLGAAAAAAAGGGAAAAGAFAAAGGGEEDPQDAEAGGKRQRTG